jgi:hypothetical protein
MLSIGSSPNLGLATPPGHPAEQTAYPHTTLCQKLGSVTLPAHQKNKGHIRTEAFLEARLLQHFRGQFCTQHSVKTLASHPFRAVWKNTCVLEQTTLLESWPGKPIWPSKRTNFIRVQRLCKSFCLAMLLGHPQQDSPKFPGDELRNPEMKTQVASFENLAPPCLCRANRWVPQSCR